MTNVNEKIKRDIEALGITKAQVLRDTGLKHRWLYKLLAGRIADPGIKRVTILTDYLESQKRGEKRKPKK